jgi:hypothetical protein
MGVVSLAAAWRVVRVWGPLIAAVICFALYRHTSTTLVARTAERDSALNVAKGNAAALNKTRADVEVVTKQATAQAVATKREADTRFASLKQEYDRDLHVKTAAAQRDAADFVRTHSVRVEAGSGGADPGRLASAGVPGAAPASRKPADAGGTAVVVAPGDIGLCTAAVIRLQNAVDWAMALTGAPASIPATKP